MDDAIEMFCWISIAISSFVLWRYFERLHREAKNARIECERFLAEMRVQSMEREAELKRLQALVEGDTTDEWNRLDSGTAGAGTGGSLRGSGNTAGVGTGEGGGD